MTPPHSWRQWMETDVGVDIAGVGDPAVGTGIAGSRPGQGSMSSLQHLTDRELDVLAERFPLAAPAAAAERARRSEAARSK